MLTDSQITQFEVFGFLVLKGMLTSGEIARARCDFDVGLTAAQEGMNRFGIRGQLNWSNLRPETPFLASLLEDQRFFGVAQQLLGEDSVGYYANSNSFTGDRTEWHPDVIHPDWRGIKLAFYLQPLKANSGALRFIPGSHKEPLLSDIKKVSLRESNDGEIDTSGLDVDEVPAFAAESDPGDVVLFDNHTWHASYGGGKNRRMCSLGYFASPKTRWQDAAVKSMVESDKQLSSKFPLLAKHPQWLSNDAGDPIRGRWITSLRKFGFV